MERATGTEVYGCGSPHSTDITLNIQTTTGGNFTIGVNGKNTVEHLKKLVSKKLKVSKDRICLLHRERQLRDGTLEENGLLDGSRVILLPSVETGLLSQRPENSVMQALESLNDSQVNDFLSGKSPLNLTMRLGEHMMLIQLQLSTLNGAASIAQNLRNNLAKTAERTKCEPKDTPSPQATLQTSTQCDNPVTGSEQIIEESHRRLIEQQDLEMLQSAIGIYKKMAEEQFSNSEQKADMDALLDFTERSLDNEQSPIKSLSNLVSCPHIVDRSYIPRLGAAENKNLLELLSSKTSSLVDEPVPSTSAMADQACPMTSHTSDSSISDDSDNFSDQSSFLSESTIDEYPMENLFNKGLFDDQDESMMDREISNLATTSHGTQEQSVSPLPSFQSLSEPLKSKRFQYMLHKTSKFKSPVGLNKQKTFIQSVVNKHKKKSSNQTEATPQPSTSRTDPFMTSAKKPVQVIDDSADTCTPSTSKQFSFKAPDAPKKVHRVPTPPVDTKALIEASKNLTQKLKKLSKEVLTNKIDLRAAEETVRTKVGRGAVIETMKHHGKGIFSGTFSGTLNPALQDRYGRPKRDISTIIHILNDLLCAAPPVAAIAQKESKHTCFGNEVEDHITCLACQASCSVGHCDGHPSSSRKCACSGKECQCSRLVPELCLTCEGKPPHGEMCKKCDTAKTLAIENTKTKCKLEQLRLVMQQKKQRREARKLKSLPYPIPQSISPTEKANAMKEEVETVG